jgi:hypothetical protein
VKLGPRTLQEDDSFWLYEDGLLGRIFRTKEEIMGGGKCNEELHQIIGLLVR